MEMTGKRMQIRGFPQLWTDKLNLEEIGWYLFDLLIDYGEIADISVSLSKKDAIVYGVVDMMKESDVERIFRELDEKDNLSLPDWSTTLQFKRINVPSLKVMAQPKVQVTQVSDQENSLPLRELVVTNSNESTIPIALEQEIKVESKLCENNENSSPFKFSMDGSTHDGNGKSAIRYNREQIFALKEFAPSKLVQRISSQFPDCDHVGFEFFNMSSTSSASWQKKSENHSKRSSCTSGANKGKFRNS